MIVEKEHEILAVNLLNAAVQNIVLKLPTIFNESVVFSLEDKFLFQNPTVYMDIKGSKISGFLLTFIEPALLDKFTQKHLENITVPYDEMTKELTNILMGSLKVEFTRTDSTIQKTLPTSLSESNITELLNFDGPKSNLKFKSQTGNIFICIALKIIK